VIGVLEYSIHERQREVLVIKTSGKRQQQPSGAYHVQRRSSFVVYRHGFRVVENLHDVGKSKHRDKPY